MKKMYIGWVIVWPLLLALLFPACSRLSKLEKNLNETEAQWLSEVRYIITPEERKVFLELPESERAKFIEDFWQRRDPFPDTEKNEYKEEYYQRLEQANRLFIGEGRPGWLTDRGRIFILFGPPTERQTYPMELSGFCREVWYYRSFPVVFVDEHCSGTYILSAINLEHLQDLNLAQGYFQNSIAQEKTFFDYELKVAGRQRKDDQLELKLVFKMKYSDVWFETKDDASLEAGLYIKIEIRNESNQVVWQGTKDMPMTFKDEDEFNQKKKKTFSVSLDINLPDGQYQVPPPGKYYLYSSVKQMTSEVEIKKVKRINL
ncbi:MAG: GWxTD domain-containing protein [Acidobacteriota bacterium]|nr:GWxTD domain-containing protein [Acidobacteriota bacterium]